MPLASAFICTTLRLEQHALHRLRDALGEDVHEIAIGARQQARRHLDDGDGAAERGVDGAELEADVAAADDEERLRDVGQIERGGRVHHARIVDLQRRRNRGHRSGREHRVLELHGLLAAGHELHAQVVRVDDLGPALEVLDLAVLDELAGAARQPLDDVVLELAQLGEIDLRLAELDAPRLRVARLVDELRDVQQRLRRNAAAVHADAARIQLPDRRARRRAEIGGQKRGGVPARAAADDDELSGDHTTRSTKNDFPSVHP